MGKKSSEVVGLTLDSGALIGLERGEERIRALLRVALERGFSITIPAAVLAQSWRGGPRAARVARLLKDRERVELVSLDETEAYPSGSSPATAATRTWWISTSRSAPGAGAATS